MWDSTDDPSAPFPYVVLIFVAIVAWRVIEHALAYVAEQNEKRRKK